MKSLVHYIQEKLVIKKNKHNYFPETKKELQDIIEQRIKEEGNNANLNDIDISNITDMSYLFANLFFKGDISKWNVSNVTNMSYMFYDCFKFNQDISSWNVSKVKYMNYMFKGCKEFNQDISNWNVSNVKNYIDIFSYCPIEEKFKPKFSI